jgi:hypothetical protein
MLTSKEARSMLGRLAGRRSAKKQREQKWPNLQKAWSARRRKAAQKRQSQGLTGKSILPISDCGEDATPQRHGLRVLPGILIHPGRGTIVDTRFAGMAWGDARARGLTI